METAISSFGKLMHLLDSDGCSPPVVYDHDVEVEKTLAPDHSITNCGDPSHPGYK